ncbi:MAG: peptidylprolyl isomerase [Bacteroidetes bacterium]|nr:peptidylprolyl isomerase [Bacteroidota bacterium]
MKRFFIAFTAVALSCISLQGQVQHVDGILAVVGDKIVLRSDFETEKAQFMREPIAGDSSQLYCLILRRLITKRLLLNQAELDSLPLAEDRIDAEIDNRLRYFQRQAGSQAELERYLGKTISEYREEIRPKMKEQLLTQEMETKVTSNIKISPQEVKQFYENIPKDSLPLIPTEVEVAQLIIEPPVSQEAKDFAKSQLQELKARIQRGESFEKLARAYSMDPGSKDNGGLLPEFGRGEMVPEFERMAFKMKPDSLSEVFESSFGYHLMKLVKRKGERVIARHILIRAENTSADYAVVMARMDSIFYLLNEKQITWCDAVKKYGSTELSNRGYCGFLNDENTGLQRIVFDALPSEIKQVVDKLKPGEFSEAKLTLTQDGRQVYRMVYLKSMIAPHEANLIQDYSRIQLEAEADKKQQALDTWVEKNRKQTYIRINRDFISCPELWKWESTN